MNINKKIIGYGLTAAAVIPTFILAPGKATKQQKAPFMGKNFAHRGLHSRDKSVPENSLEAFRLAAEMGYGVELDVQLSKDGYVVVFHDDTLDRVCGVHAKVEDKTWSELRQMKLCGTEQTIPLFSDVLETINGRGPIICELKSTKRRNELCRKTYEFIHNYQGDICVESFDPMIVVWFRLHARELVRGQLAMPANCYDRSLGLPLAFCLSRTFGNFASRPQFIAYKIGNQPLSVHIAYALGAMRVAWTSHEPRNEKGKDVVIFEFYKPRLKFK